MTAVMSLQTDTEVFEHSDTYPVSVLFRSTVHPKRHLFETYYKDGFLPAIPLKDIIIQGCYFPPDTPGKVPVKTAKLWIADYLSESASIGIKYIYCADATYFKLLTAQPKAEATLGYALPCLFKDPDDKSADYSAIKVVYGINHQTLVYNPAGNRDKLHLSIETLVNVIQGNRMRFDEDIIKQANYASELSTLNRELASLLSVPILTCDVETFSLHPVTAGLGTIGFASSPHTGLVATVDIDKVSNQVVRVDKNTLVPRSKRLALRDFFTRYTGTLVFHNATFDLKVLIHEIFMSHSRDIEGMLQGLNVLTRKFHCTKQLAYLCMNTTADLSLGLKSLTQSFAGNYALDDDEIKDICQLPIDKLVRYNLIDCCATYWLYQKLSKQLIEENQQEIYNTIFLPSIRTIVQAELVGLPVNKAQVAAVTEQLDKLIDFQTTKISQHPQTLRAQKKLTSLAWRKDYTRRKEAAKNPDKIVPKDRRTFPPVIFNPYSNQHLNQLFFSTLGLPVLEKTPKGNPSVGAEIIKSLCNHTTADTDKALLEDIVELLAAAKIRNTFMPPFLNATPSAISAEADNGVCYVHGNFNLGGTVSARLSSSSPNLQNLPAKGMYGKLIKSCVRAPDGWLFVGADYSSLEDRISALTTQDPNKLAVYENNYDGHCLRAYTYFKDQMPDIEPTLESINSIEHKYPDLRQRSKAPTFLLTYGGTHFGLMKNCGFSRAEALHIENEYHKLYTVSDDWVAKNIAQAQKTGYVVGAFGLRVRTPLLPRVDLNSRSCPYEAHQEKRTAGNALGQSWCLLNNRSTNEFMERVWAHPEYRVQVLPSVFIHDASYFLVRDNLPLVKWVNDNLIECMQWQEHPDIAHPVVKLGGELDVHYQSWANPITLPNNATEAQIADICAQSVASISIR